LFVVVSIYPNKMPHNIKNYAKQKKMTYCSDVKRLQCVIIAMIDILHQ
jgi:hypothetical protein